MYIYICIYVYLYNIYKYISASTVTTEVVQIKKLSYQKATAASQHSRAGDNAASVQQRQQNTQAAAV